MHCRRCGAPLAPGARFCGGCGAAADATPLWLRVVGAGSAVVVLAALVALALGTETEDVIGDVVAGEWDCELAYDSTEDDPPLSTDWEVEFFDDGRLTVEDRNESAEGEWEFEDGRVEVDFGDADLGNPELTTQTIDVSSLDELTILFERTDQDDEDDVGDRTLTCERES